MLDLQLYDFSTFVMKCRGIQKKPSRETGRMVLDLGGPYWEYCSIVKVNSTYNVWRSSALSGDRALRLTDLSIRKVNDKNINDGSGDVSRIPRAANVQCRFYSIAFGSMIRRTRESAVMWTICCVFECSTIGLATLITL